MSQQRYENLRQHNEEVMMLGRDMKYNCQLLCQSTNNPKAVAYPDELIDQNEQIRPVIQSGNDMLDTILCSRLGNAMDEGIEKIFLNSPLHLI